MPINSLHPDYQAWRKRWQKMSDAFDGSARIKEQNVEYLPLLGSEEDTSANTYKLRLRLSEWYDAPARTLDLMLGMVSRNDPNVAYLNDNPAMVLFMDSADGKGTPLSVMSLVLLKDVLRFGRTGVLVDYHDGLGYPYLAHYTNSAIINWSEEDYRDARGTLHSRLRFIVLLETYEEPSVSDRFLHDVKQRYRLLALDEDGYYYQQTFTQVDESDTSSTKSGEASFEVSEAIYPTMRGQRLTEIPFYFLSSSAAVSRGTQIDRPLLEPIVDLCLRYYELSGDMMTGLHFAALPTPVVVNAGDEPPNTLGPSKIWSLNGEGADAFYLTFDGKGMPMLGEELDKIKKKIQELGARGIESLGISNVSTRTVELHSLTDNASLAMVVTALNHLMTEVLVFVHKWAAPTEGAAEAVQSALSENMIDFAYNTDFVPLGVDPEMLKSMVAAVQGGLISTRTFLEFMKRGEMVDPELSYEEYLMELDEDNARMPAVEDVQAPVIGTQAPVSDGE